MGGLFSKPKVAKPPPPERMPDPDDPAVREARRKELMKARLRSGKASTILSGDDPYSNTTLGVG